jgi:hypothetical protein
MIYANSFKGMTWFKGKKINNAAHPTLRRVTRKNTLSFLAMFDPSTNWKKRVWVLLKKNKSFDSDRSRLRHVVRKHRHYRHGTSEKRRRPVSVSPSCSVVPRSSHSRCKETPTATVALRQRAYARVSLRPAAIRLWWPRLGPRPSPGY